MDLTYPLTKTRKRHFKKKIIPQDEETRLRKKKCIKVQENYLLQGTCDNKTQRSSPPVKS